MTTLKRCNCGKFAKYGGWTKPDKTQLGLISIALNRGTLKIENAMCDTCKNVYFGLIKEK